MRARALQTFAFAHVRCRYMSHNTTLRHQDSYNKHRLRQTWGATSSMASAGTSARMAMSSTTGRGAKL